MTCSRAPPPSTWTTTTMLCNDRNAIALWSHNQHRRQQREISSDLDTAHHTIENFWMASSCSPRACQTFGSIAPSSSRFDNLPLDVDKKMFRSSSSSSTQCCKIAPKEGRLHIHDHDQPPRSITFVVSPASSSSTHQQNPNDSGNRCDGCRMPEVTRQMLEYLWTEEEEDDDESSLGDGPDGITTSKNIHSMVDALCGPND